jgi:hypothetical protein
LSEINTQNDLLSKTYNFLVTEKAQFHSETGSKSKNITLLKRMILKRPRLCSKNFPLGTLRFTKKVTRNNRINRSIKIRSEKPTKLPRPYHTQIWAISEGTRPYHTEIWGSIRRYKAVSHQDMGRFELPEVLRDHRHKSVSHGAIRAVLDTKAVPYHHTGPYLRD